MSNINIQKRSGKLEKLDISKIQKQTKDATFNLNNVSPSELEIDAQIKFVDGMKSAEIQDSLIKTAVEKIDIDAPNWTFVASRLFLYDMYHKVGTSTNQEKGIAYSHLKDYVKYGQECNRIISGLEEGYDLDDLNNYIEPQRDYQFNYLGLKTLYDRYILKDNNKNPIELPQQMFMGIAMFLAQKEEDKQQSAKEFYDLISKFEVMLATPTLSNARTNRHQLSSCFKKGTLVQTINNYKAIDELIEGDLVLTDKGTYEQVTELFTRNFASKMHSLNIKGQLNNLEATEEHPVRGFKRSEIVCTRGPYKNKSICPIMQNNHKNCKKSKGQFKEDCELTDTSFKSEYRAIKEYNGGDFLHISYPKTINTNKFNLVDIINIDNLYVKDDILLCKNTPSVRENGYGFYNNQLKGIPNELIIDNDFARLIGYFLAEGHIFKNNQGISFTFGSHEDFYIKDTYNILVSKFSNLNIKIKINKDNSTNVTVHNKLVGELFYELCGKGFNNKILSDHIFFIDPKIQEDILIGVIRGDGTMVKEGLILTLSNKELINQLFKIALRCNLSPFMKELVTISPLAAETPYSLKFNVKDIEFFNKVGKNLEKLKSKKSQILNRFWHNNEYYMEIDSTESEFYEGTVYNIEVNKEHTYNVNNISVHNCFIGASGDNIEGIFDAFSEQSLLSKFGGGIGWDWNNIRSLGGTIDGHKGASGGLIPPLKIENDIALYVDQLGCVSRDSYVEVLDQSNESESSNNEPIYKRIKIQNVKKNMFVKSFNINTSKIEPKLVLETCTLQVKKENQTQLRYKDGGFTNTSDWHKSLVFRDNEFKYIRADEVISGDIGVDENNNKVEYISSIKPGVSENYCDLEVKDNNNYFCTSGDIDSITHVIHNTRKGAIAVYIEPWHMDVEDFLDLKKNSGEERRRAHDLFPALWINDLFMERIQEDGDWTLFNPYDVPDLHNMHDSPDNDIGFKQQYEMYEKNEDIEKVTIKAKTLWKKILTSYFESGSPFLCFKDTANRGNPLKDIGNIYSSNLCVTGDTRLHTQHGLVQAKELEEMNSKIQATCDNRTYGDRNNRGTFNAECIEMYKTKENAKIYEIITNDGYKIKSTEWHEYYIQRDKKIIKLPLKDINQKTDKLLIQSQEGQFGSYGNYNEGLLLGLVTGDGTFSTNNNGTNTVNIELYNNEMDSLSNKVHDTLFNITGDKKDIPSMIKHSENSSKRRFSSVKLANLFNKKYQYTKETKLKVPENIFKGTKETIKGYLQGIFTTDGSINKHMNDNIPTYSIQLSSKELILLEGIQMLLSNFGIKSTINNNMRQTKANFNYTTKDREYKEYNSEGVYRLDLKGNNAIKFKDYIGFLSEKQDRCNSIENDRINSGYSKYERKQEYFETKIKSINYIGNEDVYDTTQLVNHSLIFNGLVTGNCTEIFQNTTPDTYVIDIELDDGTWIKDLKEDQFLTVCPSADRNGIGYLKEAKKITSIDKIVTKHTQTNFRCPSVIYAHKRKIPGKTAVCNLASVNLSKINTQEDIKRVVPVAVRMLDNVIDLNFYPTKKAQDTNKLTRAIGLGVMGEGQMLAEKGIYFGSKEHLKLIDNIMEDVSYYTIESSMQLAKEKGAAPDFASSEWAKGILPVEMNTRFNDDLKNLLVKNDLDINRNCSKWDFLSEMVKEYGVRNLYMMAIAPTSSISILVGTTQAIEPTYKRKWFEENLSGQIPVVAPNLSPETYQYYTPAFEVDQMKLIEAAAIRGRWLDQGQATNIFMSLDKASGKYLHEIYTHAWKLGCKSTYYLRSQSPEAQQEADVADRKMECAGCQ